MAKVIGVGGVFLQCRDVAVTREWYARVLGLEMADGVGAMLAYQPVVDQYAGGALSIVSPFASDTDYFAPSTENHMVNFIVDDLTAILARAAGEGVAEAKPREDHSYGSFGWVMDPDGRKVELWEPKGEPA